MLKEILILKNTPKENPGLLEIVLKKHNLGYQIVDFDNTTILRPIENYSALIVLGGPESANDLTPKMLGELTLIKEAIQSGVPYLGICLGLQTLVKATGGKVLKCKVNEVGFRAPDGGLFKIVLTREGKKDRLFNNLPDILTVFQLHGETVGITPQMTLLATGEYCRNQIVRFGETAYGIQSHFELTDDLLESWITGDSDLRKLNAGQLRSDFESIKADYFKTGQQLFLNFLSLGGLIK
jgi:GMP synthase-like glutamine amidotransferase